MKNPSNSGYDDLDDLLRQVDELVSDPVPQQPEYEPSGDDFFDSVEEAADQDFDPDDYAPDDYDPDECEDGSVLYQNYSNHYGADIRNYSNGYGSGQTARPQPQREPSPVIPAYNADFQHVSRQEQGYANEFRERDDRPRRKTKSQAVAERQNRQAERQPRRRRARRGPGCGCMTLIVLLIVVILGGAIAYRALFRMPKADVSIGERKKDSASILICGTDWEGARTDTMMLVYLSGSDREIGLLSLPRDTYTLTSRGNPAKLNSAYGRNGSGAEGMEGLLDYVQEIIGYRPDGYVLVSMDLVTQIVDLMGGLNVEVPMTFDLEGEHLEEGMQHLTGNQVLQLLRFREGYAMQDLGRVEVQRSVIKAAMEQWAKPSHIKDVAAALKLVDNHSVTTLSGPNCMWIAKVLLTGMGNITTNTLPGYATYIDGVSYYVLNRDDVASMINESYNPYEVEIRPGDLKIAG